MMPSIQGVVEEDIEKPTLVFHAMKRHPTTGEMKGVLVGDGILTQTHSGNLWGERYGGDYEKFTANEPVWSGARVVENVCPYGITLNSLTNVGLTVGSGETDPDGGTEAYSLTATASQGTLTSTVYTATNSMYYEDFIGSIWLKRVSGTGRVRIGDNENWNKSNIEHQLTDEWQRFTQVVGAGYLTRDFSFQVEIFNVGDVIHAAHMQIERIPKGNAYLSSSNRIMNGNFNDSSHWSFTPSNWSVSTTNGGVLLGSGTEGNYSLATTEIELDPDKVYRLVFDIKSHSNSRLRLYLHGSSNYQTYESAYLKVGWQYSRYLQPTCFSAGTKFSFNSDTNEFNGHIDNVFMYETSLIASEYVRHNAGSGSSKKYYGTKNNRSTQKNRVLTEMMGDPIEDEPWIVHQPSRTVKVSTSTYPAGPSQWYNLYAYPVKNIYGIDGARYEASSIIDNRTSNYAYIRNIPVGVTPNTYGLWQVTIGRDEDDDIYPQVRFADGSGYSSNYVNRVAVQLNTKTGDYTTNQGVGDWDVAVKVTESWITVWCRLKIDSAYSTSRFDCFVAAHTTWGTGNVEVGHRRGVNFGNVMYFDNIHNYVDSANVYVESPPYVNTATSNINVAATGAVSFDATNHGQSNGAYYIEWSPSFDSATSPNVHWQILSIAGTGLLYYDGTNNTFKTYDGVNQSALSATTYPFSAHDILRIGFVYDAANSKLRVCVNGNWGNLANYDGAYASGNPITVCNGNPLPMRVRDLRRYTGVYDVTYPFIDKLIRTKMSGGDIL